MAAEPEAVAETAPEASTDAPAKAKKAVAEVLTGSLPPHLQQELRIPPIKVRRKVSKRTYKFICNLDHIPTEESLGRDLGPGVYKLEGAAGGEQVWDIGELEIPLSAYPDPTPIEPGPPEPSFPPSPAPTNGQGINVAHRLGLMEARLEYGFLALNRVLSRLERTMETTGDAQEEAIGDLRDEVFAVQKYLSELERPEVTPQKTMIEQMQELANMRATWGQMSGVFGEQADPNSIMGMVGPELAHTIRDFRQMAMPGMTGQPGQVPQGYPQGYPQQQGYPPPQQPQQPPPPPPGFSHYDPQRGWIPLQQQPQQQGPPQIPGITEQNGQEIWEFAVKLGEATRGPGQGFSWEEIAQFAAMHGIGAAELIEMARGQREVPGMETPPG